MGSIEIKRGAAFSVECVPHASGLILSMAKSGIEVFFYRLTNDFSLVDSGSINLIGAILPSGFSFEVMEIHDNSRSPVPVKDPQEMERRVMQSERYMKHVFKKKVLMVFGPVEDSPFWKNNGFTFAPVSESFSEYS